MGHALFYNNNLILIWYLKNPSKHTLDMAIQSREKVTNMQKLNLLIWVFGAGWLDLSLVLSWMVSSLVLSLGFYCEEAADCTVS